MVGLRGEEGCESPLRPPSLLPGSEAIKFLSPGLNSMREAINPCGAKFSNYAHTYTY